MTPQSISMKKVLGIQVHVTAKITGHKLRLILRQSLGLGLHDFEQFLFDTNLYPHHASDTIQFHFSRAL